jgi:hypothetical protein
LVTGPRIRLVQCESEFRSVCEPEFAVDMLEGVVDGAYGDPKALGDRPAGQPSGGESGDLVLTRGEIWWLGE